MRLVELKCESFRSLSKVDFRPQPGINVIRGYNAQGKTTVLEALFFLATSRSHRTTVEKDLVQEGKEGFHARALVQRHDRAVTVEASWWRNVKRFKVNGVPQTRMSDILGKIGVVMSSPEDVGLVKGSGSQRRQFLDMALSQVLPRYLNALQHYRQVLKQRNQLLRNPHAEAALLDVWDEQLATHGAVLIEERTKYLDQLDKLARVGYAQIAEEERLDLRYQPDVTSPEMLAGVLQQARNSDLLRGTTQRGPHRDDFEFIIAGRAARSFASQGQQRTAALAVKLADVELIHQRTGDYPLLLLDEILSELDEKRAGRLFTHLHQGVQCFLTTANMTNTIPSGGHTVAVYRISGGRIEEE
ncbi:MAG: DNA replication/repair protein RecF [FCB group bacterium]|jgi:DNA replication and repair protein RecF|nr:DNA replication/repair protein RecF [FCB group bacterium]